MIDAKKSKFKKLTKFYVRDSVFDIIDIEEAIKKNGLIHRCKDNFIYSSCLSNEVKKIKVNLEEYVFEFDNGHIKYFTEYYQVIDVIGEGSYGVVLSAYDLSKKGSKVAIKVVVS